jgi:serine protease Do
LSGALITKVEPGSAAGEAGLQSGDVIQEIDRQTVSDAESAIRLTRESQHQATLVRVWRQGGSRYVVIDESQNS